MRVVVVDGMYLGYAGRVMSQNGRWVQVLLDNGELVRIDERDLEPV